MSERTHHFDLKLLTASKDVGLRRLRSYAASLGGGAQIFHSAEDLCRSLETAGATAEQNIVLHDTSLVLNTAQIADLRRLSRVFQLHQPCSLQDLSMPAKGSPSWELESYIRCTLTAFFESAVVRMSMAHLCKADRPFHLEHLLRWGYAAQTWQAQQGAGKASVAEAGLAFVRSLKLAGESRRLTEMASHFLQTRLAGLGLKEEAVTFGSDGLTTTVIARCHMAPSVELADVARELRIHDFPVAIINQLAPGICEIGALSQLAGCNERMVMVFRKINRAQKVQPLMQAPGVLSLKLGKVG